MKLRKQRLLLLFLPVFLGLSACSTVSSVVPEQSNMVEQEVREENPLKVVVNLDTTDQEMLLENPWLNRSRFIGGLLYQGLLKASVDVNNVQPDLCKEFTISPDGRTYVFHLAEDIYWHDGNKVTIEDVKWSIETCLLSERVNGYLKKGLQRIEGSQEYEKGKEAELRGLQVKDNSLIIKITESDGNFLSELAQLAILPRHYFTGMTVEEIENSDFWQSPIGSGPYKFKEKKSNREIVLEVNKEYKGTLPKIEQISCLVLDSDNEADFDFGMTSDPKNVKKYQENPDYRVVKSNNLYYRYLMFNVDGRSGEAGELLKNRKIRQALYIGLDRKNIIQEIYQDTAVPLDTGVEEDSVWHVKSSAYETEYNPLLAKAILEEEGFDFEQPFVLTRYHHDELSVKLLEKIADCWRELGIKVQIIPIEQSDTNVLWENTDWYHVALKNLAAVDYSEWYYEYSSENQLWSNVLKNRKEFDQLINSLHRSNWAYQRKELYLQLQLLELNSVYKIPLASIPQYVIYNSSKVSIPLEEFPNLWYYFDLNMEDWELKKK